MRFVLLFLSLALAIGTAGILTDPFHEAQNNCNYSASAPYSACDVIGAEPNYDIQMVSANLGAGTATVSIYLNTAGVTGSGGGMSLTSFSDGDTLIVGDLFFYDPSDPLSTLKFGVPLQSHGNFTSGYLYGIGGGVGTETAFQALNGSQNLYRRDTTVLLTGAGAQASTGSVTVHNYGDGITNALYEVILTFATTSSFLNLVSDGQIGILFSAADCGNDVIDGSLSVFVPEPEPAYLIAIGLLIVAAVSLWRRRVRRHP